MTQERALLHVRDFEEEARRRLSPPVWDYLAGGSGDESAVHANQAVLDRLGLHPRVLTGTAGPDLGTTLLGRPLRVPLGVAPMAHHRLFHPEGEVATAQGAGSAGALFIASIFANRTLQEMAGAASGPLWLQLYWLRRRDQLEKLVASAEEAGFGALVLTVDAPVVARRPRDLRNAFSVPADVRAVNLDSSVMTTTHRAVAGTSALAAHSAEQFDTSVGWADLAWLRGRTKLPLLLKGVLTAQDARLAVEHGMDGVVVSNHGGRQLPGAVTAVAALPEIAAEVRGRCAVLVDGSFRHGSDVLKALALGADTVLIGRPALWGLTCGGSTGVAAVLGLLRDELAEAMLLCGLPELNLVDRTLLHPHDRPPGGRPA
ncbi:MULTISPECIES: alpha-hydroxy acid oxidase [unclassified Streptomyces]|uniref:alpha-hydroxy acid oxidase n=1 Tax=unclassified Streptomyces TaxID=2593676 RepID=UPI0031BA752A